MSSPPKLDKSVLKSILILNHHIPAENMKYWVTVDEIRDRLVHCGVDRALSSDMVFQALSVVNRSGILMTKRPDGNTKYYRPSLLWPFNRISTWSAKNATGLQTSSNFTRQEFFQSKPRSTWHSSGGEQSTHKIWWWCRSPIKTASDPFSNQTN